MHAGSAIYHNCIFLLEYVPRLFLSGEELKLLEDLIIVRPHWLISIMTVIMELNTKDRNQNLTTAQISQLEKTGLADLELLEVCWERFISVTKSSSDYKIEIKHLCLILQAYCLVYPVSASSENNCSKFIIPCKLPEVLTNQPQLPGCSCFGFDFRGFLPAEVYHRLICLASRQAKPACKSGTKDLQNLYSSKKCVFRFLEGTHWIMEMDSENHMLHFKVMYVEVLTIAAMIFFVLLF